MAALTFALIEAGTAGLASPLVVATLAVGLLFAAAFVAIEKRVRQPMVPLGMLRSTSVGIPSIVGLAFMFAYYGAIFLVSLFLQDRRGLSPLETGLAFMPMTLLVTVANPLVARIVEKVGLRPAVLAGHALLAIGLAALVVAAPTAPGVVVAMILIPIGLSGPLMIPPVTAHLLERTPANRAGTASGVLNTSRQVGAAAAIAIFGGLVAAQSTFVQGMQASLLIAIALLALSCLASLRLPTHRSANGRANDTPSARKRVFTQTNPMEVS
jgi:DHA2 family methylenomycin A resistance protein-like MFS transporter